VDPAVAREITFTDEAFATHMAIFAEAVIFNEILAYVIKSLDCGQISNFAGS
jgi:hypothetical protein